MIEKRAATLRKDPGEPRLLLAAFSAFPGTPRNPTQDLVERFDRRTLRQPARLYRTVLPVEWDRSWLRLESEIAARRPDAVVLFGLDGGARRLRLERRAANERLTDRPDAAGAVAAGPRVCSGPDHLVAAMPYDAIGRGLRATGIDYEMSDDAGRYLCNETLFRLCRAASAHGLRCYGFVHVPHTEETAVAAEAVPTLRAATLAAAAAVILDCVAADVTNRSPSPALAEPAVTRSSRDDN